MSERSEDAAIPQPLPWQERAASCVGGSCVRVTTPSTRSPLSGAVPGGRLLLRQNAVYTFRHNALLPTSDAGLRLSRRLHDRGRFRAFVAESDDLRSPDMLLRRTACRDDCVQPNPVGRGNLKCDT